MAYWITDNEFYQIVFKICLLRVKTTNFSRTYWYAETFKNIKILMYH